MQRVHLVHARGHLDDPPTRAHRGSKEIIMTTTSKLGIALAFGMLLATTASADHSSTTTRHDTTWIPLDAKAGAKGPQVSVVFGDLKTKAPIGFLFKTPAGFRPGVHTHSSDDFAVIIEGHMHNFAAGKDQGPALGAGEQWHQLANEPHDNFCEAGADCLMFVYMPNGFDFKPAKP